MSYSLESRMILKTRFTFHGYLRNNHLDRGRKLKQGRWINHIRKLTCIEQVSPAFWTSYPLKQRCSTPPAFVLSHSPWNHCAGHRKLSLPWKLIGTLLIFEKSHSNTWSALNLTKFLFLVFNLKFILSFMCQSKRTIGLHSYEFFFALILETFFWNFWLTL